MERNVNCVNSRAIIGYVKGHCPEFLDKLLEGLDPFFDSIDNVEEYLADEHNWFSQHVCATLFERVRVYTGNPDVARIIGHESITQRRFGYIENIFIKAFANPYFSILRAPTINAKFNKTKSVEIVKSGWNHATIRLRWFPGLGSTKDICQYNLGVYEAIPTIWGLPLATSNEIKCLFEGNDYCEYSFEWTKKFYLSMIFSKFVPGKKILDDSIIEIEREKKLLEKKYREVEVLNEELNKRINRLTSLDSCSKATISILDTDKLLNVVMSLIVNILQFDRAILMLIDEKKNALIPVKIAGGDERAFEILKDYSIPLERKNNLLARVVDSGIAKIIKDVPSSYLSKENIILQKFKPKSFVAVPLITRNKVIGVLGAERISGLDDFNSVDLDYMMNFCNQIAISLDNAKLIDNMQKSFVTSILSLASALEAKDPYTRGHSNRVATYSTIIARRLGLEDERVETIRLMALMHDIGKIGIPDSIINNPGRLTDEEFMKIKQHPNLSLRIIEQLVEHNPAICHVKSHHERYDGLGYPDGLSGDDIPLEARIMAVADSYDAMTTNRSYRGAMTKGAALEEIINNKGTQFCPEIADEFIHIINNLPDDLYRMILESPEELVKMDFGLQSDSLYDLIDNSPVKPSR